MNAELWLQRTARLTDPAIERAVIVQCDVNWLRPQRMDLRNEIDQAVLTAQLRRGASLRITRVVLHNLPASSGRAPDSDAVRRAFDEWNYRLAATGALFSGPAAQVHRLIIPGDQAVVSVPDMVELLEDGRWSNPQNAVLALRTIGADGASTPLTGYDVDLEGPFSDGDPSVHM
ncbi:MULTISPECIES: hypothetical protein [unclassified Streptomyces]|uniref:hypothetical protein n=1 Tax=unclassified Streptomyces TaxID=2593676 RepID=UPI002024D294|nr:MULTISPECIES: hypothetical protein [unclassified Streptomyces]WSC22316.1 hypothetical protein OIE60_22970 [Streptomyces sp. NBC_01766]